MGIMLKLRWGGYELNLNDNTRFGVAQGFRPPSLAAEVQRLEAPSGERYTGSGSLEQTFTNRTVTFSVSLISSSYEGLTRAQQEIEMFLLAAGDDLNPVFIEYRQDDTITHNPLWGQTGGSKFWEVVRGQVGFDSDAAAGASGQSVLPDLVVEVEIRPVALGYKQLAAQATGGVVQGHGTVIGQADTNLYTNSVFGSPTYSTGWTFGAGVLASKNTDPRYLLPGTENSLYLKGISGANNYAYQAVASLPAATTMFYFFAKAPNGGTLTASDISFYEQGAVYTPTLVTLRNGWYLVYNVFASPGGTRNCGVAMSLGKSAYVSGFFTPATARTFPEPLIMGDMLGNAWTTTAHASTSSRTAGRVRLPVTAQTFNTAEFTVALAVRWPVLLGSYTGNKFLFSCGSASLRAYYDIAAGAIKFTDNTNTATYTIAASTLANTDKVYHFVAKPGTGLTIYENGVSKATAGTYAIPSTEPSYMYFGTDHSAANHSHVVFYDGVLFDGALAQAEVTAHSTQMLALLTDTAELPGLFWRWSKDGTDKAFNYNDATDENYVVFGGVPGTLPAECDYDITPDRGTAVGLGSAWLSNWACDFFIDPKDALFAAYATTTAIGTTATVIGSGSVGTKLKYSQMAGREFRPFFRINDALATNLMVALGYSISSTPSYALADYRAVTSVAGIVTMVYGRSILLFDKRLALLDDSDVTMTPGMASYFKRTTGSGNVTHSATYLLAEPVMQFVGSGGAFRCRFGTRRTPVVMSTGAPPAISGANVTVTGTLFELEPRKFNIVCNVLAANSSSDTTAAMFVLHNATYITPRYALL